MFDVNFNDEFKILTHPSHAEKADLLRRELANLDFTSHYALFSSGTSSRELKGYILSEKAMEANAKAVNEWFSLKPDDVWGLSLPTYHVGGLSVLVRARLLENRVVDLRKWDPIRWHESLTQEKVTITTIVPAQLYDLVKNNLSAPEKLKSLIVGGDFLATELEAKAIALGWPVIRTYGMTEVCSQLASGKASGDQLQLLPLHEVKTTEDGTLAVKSPALFTAQFIIGEKLKLKLAQDLCDQDGFYVTQDRVGIQENILKPHGRKNDEIKIAGHLTDILGLKDALAKVLLEAGLYGKAEITIENDERKGNRLVLLHQSLPTDLLENITRALRPAVIDEFKSVLVFQKTELGKLKLF